MTKKLTLSIDDELAEFAHELADKSKKSISGIVSDYIRSLREKHQDNIILNKPLQDMYGIFRKNPIPDKKDLRKYFHDKNNH